MIAAGAIAWAAVLAWIAFVRRNGTRWIKKTANDAGGTRRR